MWILLGLLTGCGPKVYTPPAATEGHGLADEQGDHWGILEQASGLMDTSVRQRALFLMVRYRPEPAGGEWSERGLHDPSPYVQRRSIEALGQRLDETESQDALLRYIERPNVNPFNVAEAALLLAPGAPAGLMEQLDKKLEENRHHSEKAPIALAAARLGSTTATTILTEALAKGDFPLEINFFLRLGDTPIDGISEALVTGLPFFEEELHLPIAHTLIRLNHPLGQKLFSEALNSEDIEWQHEALDFLDSLHSPEATRLLKGASRPSKSHATLLLERRDSDFPRAAEDSLESPDRELRIQALWTLNTWSQRFPEDKKSLKVIRKRAIELLRDLEASVQHAALSLLGATGIPSDEKHLSPFLASEDPSHRVAAAGALLAIEVRTTSEP